MSFQKESASRRKIQGDAHDILPEVNLIGLAANLANLRSLRTIWKLSINEKLNLINATRTQHRSRQGLSRYVE
jgi:hypothetical protein